MTLVYRTQQLAEFWANSGSAQDIQNAVDAATAAGGGTVLVPAGNFTFNINFTSTKFSGYAGVVIPGGVNVIGAGANQTILYCPLSGWDYSNLARQSLFLLDGSNEKPIRISGITFQGSVNTTYGADDDRALKGIVAYGVKDCRIDHCVFIDFVSAGIAVSNNYVHKWNRGVIDHCIFDNPYKDTFYALTGNKPYWAYGVIVGGDNVWREDFESYYLGQYNNDTWFIEDCSFRRCRHAVAMGSSCAWAVIRHCNFTEMIVSYFGSYVDAHGGARGYEVYNNTIENCPTDSRSIDDPAYWGKYMGVGINPRGGAGVIFNNTLINFDVGSAIKLSNDQTNETYRLNGFWIWNNTFINVTSQLSTSPGSFTIDENDEYFLYAKPNYTPYTYPHPLTLEGLPPAYATPWTGELEEGTYKITVPQQVKVGSDVYNFKQWEDGSTNPVRTVNLTSNTTITAIYELMPAGKGTLECHAYIDAEEVAVPVEIVGVGTYTTPFTVELNVGDYTLNATYDTQTQTKTVAVVEGAITKVDFKFSKAPPIPLGLAFLFLLGILGAAAIAKKGGE
jgi:hypothetical protein